MDGASEVASIVAGWLVTTLVPWLVIRRDARRLAARGDAHPWNGATTACAVVVFQLFALPAHYWALRRPLAMLASLAALAAVIVGLGVAEG